MIVAIFNVYLVILFLLVRLKIVSFNLFWKVSPAIVLVAHIIRKVLLRQIAILNYINPF